MFTEHCQCTALYKKISTVNALLLRWDCMHFLCFDNIFACAYAHHKFTFGSMMLLKGPRFPETISRIETWEIAFCTTQ